MKKAMTKLKALLTNNIGLKILAVLVAAIIWLVVINVNDPQKTVVIYNIPITMTDETAITDMGMVYSLESKNNVNITVSGKRSIVSNLTADDFNATASLAELSKVNAIPVEITAKQNYIGRNITIVKQSMQTVTVSVENLEKQDFDIAVEFSGKAADGYVTGSYSSSKNSVNIKAPTSVLDRIEKVVAECDLDESSTDIEQKCNLVLYDKRGKTITSDDITMSHKKVTVYVQILKQKDVSINVNPIGNPAEGYRVAGITLSQESVKIVGADAKIDSITSLDVDGAIDITGQNSNVTQTIDLNNYLPENVSIAGDSEIEVTVNIDRLATQTYTIKTSNISIENLKDGLTAKISGKTIEVTLQGEQDVIDKVKASDISASIDLEGYDEGTKIVPVSIVLPTQTELTENVTVKVKIK